MSGSSWTAVFVLIVVGDSSNVCVSRFNTARNFISNALVSVFTPEVFTAFFAVRFIAGLIIVIGSTGTFASFISALATVALVFALLGEWAPNFVFELAVFATVWCAFVCPFAVRSI